MVRLVDLVAGIPSARIVGDSGREVSGIEYDSRLVRSGELFAALRGSDFDGHTFIANAVANGAAAVLVEEECALDVPQVVVGNSRKELATIAAAFYRNPSHELNVVGVTGTDGKTTTSYLIDGIFRQAGRRTGMIGTVQVRIGEEIDQHSTRQTTPESSEIQQLLRRMVEADIDWAVLEATSHGLDLFRLDHTRFVIAAVTNVTHEHLEYHKTIDAYRRAKGRLFERVQEIGGTCVINLDDEGAREMRRFSPSIDMVGYTMSGNLDARLAASHVEVRANGTSFRLNWQGADVDVELPLIGGFNVENALCAAGVALASGVGLDSVADGLRNAPEIPGRMTRVDEGQPFSVIVDYAHTPAALESQLTLLRSLHPEGRLICVSGSAGERDATKRPMQGAVSARLADISVFTSEDPRNEDPEAIIADIAEGAISAGAVGGSTCYCVTDRREAIHLALTLAQSGDCVLLAGKGHEGSIIWSGEKRWWDEKTVAQQELIALGFNAQRST